MSRARDLGSSINSTAAGKNLVINGGFDIWQRGTTFNNTGNETFHADRWFVVTDSVATVNVSRVDISSQGIGVRYASRVERSAGNNRTVYIHIAEGALDLVGKQVTLSFYMRKGSGLTDNIGVAFGTRTARYSAESDSAGFTVSNSSLNTSTFTRFSRTLTITSATSTAGANLFELEFAFWQAGATNAYFEITGVQLEVGSVPTPFSKSGGDIHGELVKCQRYYERWDRATSNMSIPGFNNSTTNGYHSWIFKTTKRIAPSVSLSAAGEFAVRIPGGTNQQISSISIIGNTLNESWISSSATGLTSGNGNFLVQINNSAYIEASAEI